MNNSLANDMVAGLLNNTVAIRIPDDSNEALKFLEQLSESAPNLTWNDGTPLPDFNPRQFALRNSYYHMGSCGLMWNSRGFLENNHPGITTFVNAEEVFDQATNYSNLLTDLL